MRKAHKLDDRDQQILSRLAHIQHKVESIDETNAFALRADAGKHLVTIDRIFGRSIRRAQVYLAADGTRGVNEIAAHLHVLRQAVGRELKSLGEEGVLEIVSEEGGQDIWAKKSIDHTLQITRHLQKVRGLRADGTRLPANKRKSKKK